MILAKLFFAFLKVGLFAVGGAYSFVPLMEKEVVERHGWLDKAEFSEVMGMVEVFPGAISIKFATFTGYKVAGIPGAIVANIGNLLPPVVFIMAIALAHAKYRNIPSVAAGLKMVRFAVFAMIVAVAVKLVDTKDIQQPKILTVVIISYLLLVLTKVHPALIIIGAALYGGLVR